MTKSQSGRKSKLGLCPDAGITASTKFLGKVHILIRKLKQKNSLPQPTVNHKKIVLLLNFDWADDVSEGQARVDGWAPATATTAAAAG